METKKDNFALKQLQRQADRLDAGEKLEIYNLVQSWVEGDMEREMLLEDPEILTGEDLFAEGKEYLKDPTSLLGLSTGYESLDRMTRGFAKGNFITLAGAPGRGKTMMAQSIMHNLGLEGIPSLFFSLEMTNGEVMGRQIQMHRSTGQEDMDAAGLPIYYFPNGRKATPEVIEHYINFFKENKGIKFVVLDNMRYLPKISSDARINYADWAVVLKQIAIKCDIPIMVLHHLRKMESEDSEPDEADVAETQVIVDVSDLVVLIWRDKHHPDRVERCTVKTKVAKNRKGPVGKLPFYFGTHYKLSESVSVIHQAQTQYRRDIKEVFAEPKGGR